MEEREYARIVSLPSNKVGLTKNQRDCKDKEMYTVGAAVLVRNSKKLSRKRSKLEPMVGTLSYS